MTSHFQELLAELGKTALIVAGAAWLARQVINAWLKQRLENHKDSLARESQQALEQLRSQLRIEELRESRLLDQQASIIAEVYAALERLHEALDRLAAPIMHRGGQALGLRQVAIDRFNDFAIPLP
jgi:uncharacterized membrane protein YheB (UPF0754 family)